jgi:hypothetical protein
VTVLDDGFRYDKPVQVVDLDGLWNPEAVR